MVYSVISLVMLALLAPSARASNGIDMSGLNLLAKENISDDSHFQAVAGLDTSSFLYKASSHGTSSTTFEATVADEFNSKIFHTAGDLQFYTFVGNNPSFNAESRELYVQTQADLIGESQVTVGRKLYEWSKLDQTWTMMSLWSPRFVWDELHPEIIGMTGVFYTYTTPHFQLLAFGSPLAIPERGTNAEEVNHQIIFNNPLARNLPTTVKVQGSDTALSYSLLTPPLNEILFRPNFALRGKYQFDNGFWLSANTGVLPINQVQLAAETYLNSSNNTAQVNVRPQFPMRNINTAEAGYAKKDWDIWASVSYEQPFNFENQPTWLNPIITPSSIVSAGTNIKLTSNFTFSGAALFIHEQPFNSNSQLSGVDVSLPTRFPLKQGFKVAGNWKFNEDTESNLCWIQDLLYQTHFISLVLEHSFRKSRLTLGGGADLLLADTTQGWVGQYYGDDRLRGWVKYAF